MLEIDTFRLTKTAGTLCSGHQLAVSSKCLVDANAAATGKPGFKLTRSSFQVRDFTTSIGCF